MAIIYRHSDNKINIILADCGIKVMFIRFCDMHEKDVYKLMNIATGNILLSIDVIRVNITMEITKLDFVSSETEKAAEEEVGYEEEP
jgi:hypothetical protein